MEARTLYGIAIIAIVIYVMMYIHQVADFRRNGIHPIGKRTVITTWILLILTLSGFSGGWYQSRLAKVEAKPAHHQVTKVKHRHVKSHRKHDDAKSSSSAKSTSTRTGRATRSATDENESVAKSSRTQQTTSSTARRQATRSRSTTASSQVASTPAASGVTSNDNGGVTNNNQVGNNDSVAEVSDTSTNQGAIDATTADAAPADN
ncbi:hypothetical protein [Limosilactobacillus equigenerosi]|uniref:Uncharacterized protein n=1 Tax=Limosilactobacillus equigenerosi DSM 18793 = JCM 14505 TaxID=1423742 RepID=A0A0R1USM3_9LACO|nr:hypothetical protein [Limosilactobacillus equigenerosi]KRL94650.1 hypothetical protein FC21_GL001305 [Limosilactobacillus equigenerosi DSM 18793 = JCM 14505]